MQCMLRCSCEFRIICVLLHTVNADWILLNYDGPVFIFTASHADDCDAAHLLAKSKGDEVCSSSSLLAKHRSKCIAPVLQDHLISYDSDAL